MQAMNWSYEPSSLINADELLDLLGDGGESFLDLDVASLFSEDLEPVSPTDAAQPPPVGILRSLSGLQQELPNNTNSKQVAKPKKKSSFQRQKDEAAQLQYQVVELQAQLRRLRDSSRVSGALQSGSSSKTTGFDQSVQKEALALSFWRVVAQRQLHERHQAQQENAELRKMIQEQALLAKSLERAIRKRPLLMRTQQESHSRRRTAITSQKDSELIQVLLSNVEGRLRTVESFLQAQNFTPATTDVSSVALSTDRKDVHVECKFAHVVPHGLSAVSKAVWMQTRVGELVLGSTMCPSQVLQHTDELLVTKHTTPVNSHTESTFGSVTIFSVSKRVVKEGKVLMAWERMVERTGCAARGDPMTYLNFHGCSQLTETTGDDLQPTTLFQCHVRIVPVFIESPRLAISQPQHQKFDSKHFIQILIRVQQQNSQRFMHVVQNAIASGACNDV